MRKKTLFISILLVFFMTSLGSSLLAMKYQGQEKEEIELAPKYKNFLAETQMIMHSVEKEVFQSLKTDQQRDRFMMQFWNSRGGRQRGVRANINTLRLVRMVQALDLTEDQVAAIMPAMNKNEDEKKQLQEDLQKQMRQLRQILRSPVPEEQTLKVPLTMIRTLQKTLKEKEAEFDQFLMGNLSIAQQAKYIIFSQEFYRGLQEQLENARKTQQRQQQQKRIKR